MTLITRCNQYTSGPVPPGGAPGLMMPAIIGHGYTGYTTPIIQRKNPAGGVISGSYHESGFSSGYHTHIVYEKVVSHEHSVPLRVGITEVKEKKK